MAYVWKGTVPDVESEPAVRPRTSTGVFDPAKCGTYAGYRQHQKHGVPSCRDCKDAQASYSRDYEERRKTEPARTRSFDPSACGTYAGYKRHVRYGVPTCPECREGYRVYKAALPKAAE